MKDTRSKLFWDGFEVWQYGPVIPSVYAAFQQYRSNAIRSYHLNAAGKYNIVSFQNPDFKRNFERVWEKYRDLDGIFLSQLTHQKNTAWSKANERQRSVLNDNDIYSEEEYVIGK